MVQFYLKLVMAGKLDIEEVPEKFRELVRRLIEND